MMGRLTRPAGAVAFVAMTVASAVRADAQKTQSLDAEIVQRAHAVQPKVVAWRRDIHQHPELSNREVRTSKLVADELKSLGLEVRTEVAHTGVIGVLKGGKPGKVVALRADMDALPVTEQVDLPFKSTARTQFNGQDVGVMHACGHDNHTAILLGVAEVLSGMRKQLPGTVKFIFQPAEEGPPIGEDGGASMLIKEGALENPRPSAIFGLHVWPGPVGTINYRPEGAMAAGDGLHIVVHGHQTHGAQPWRGVDPVVVASQIVLGIQTIASRQIDVSKAPAIITVATINGGVRENIIPDSVVMTGTIRTFDEEMRKDIHARVTRTAKSIADAAGATADVEIRDGGFVTYNDPALTAKMVPSLRRAAGDSAVTLGPPITASEDFADYQKVIPGLFFFLGVTPKGKDPLTAAPNHSPYFFADEGALEVGVRALSQLAVDYLKGS
jgi:amidohydrolase